MSIQNFIILLPEIFFITMTVFAMILGLFFNKIPKNNDTQYNTNIVSWSIIYSLFICLIINYVNITSLMCYNSQIISANFNATIKIVISLSVIGTLILSLKYNKDDNILAYEYSLVIALASIGMFLLVSSFDFLTLYLSLEMQTLCLYILIAINKNSDNSLEASLKYLLLSAFSSGLLLFGVTIIYGFVGSLSFDVINQIIIANLSAIQEDNIILNLMQQYINFIYIGIVFISIGLFFKINAVPFHMWVPDVYEGASLTVTNFFATAPKVAYFSILLTLIYGPFVGFFFNYNIINGSTLIIVAVLCSLSVGIYSAIYQKKIKRLIAYSAIANIAFVLLGILSGVLSGIDNILTFLIIYNITQILLFQILAAIGNKNIKVKYINDFAGVIKINPILCSTILLVLLSIAGVPPFAGFYAKINIILSIIEKNYFFLSMYALVASIISTFYYIRIAKISLFDKLGTLSFHKSMYKESSINLALGSIFLSLLISKPQYLYYFLNYATQTFI
uniref:NADH dehydrogenase subunit 2 n=1 Tax=Cyanoptyche gloeocystis TaxID=77922 RepID=A0A096Y6X1_9EUKA|nr:NADH dehydrogenase subunit 2 [Cyanoptyche gloeocystis]AIM52085.1 NADH dehydrogenase subunit 2 [Cyanoptyche gloeocystis]